MVTSRTLKPAGTVGGTGTMPRSCAASPREASSPVQFWSMPSSGMSMAPGWMLASPSSQSPPPSSTA
ncbi:MAG: hypothetical protein R2939_10740 [Kofleriaceae bacterium]